MFPLLGRCPPESGRPPEALEMLSRVGNAFFAPKKRFPGLGTHFLCPKNGFPHWECIFYAQEGSPESGADLRNVFLLFFGCQMGVVPYFLFNLLRPMSMRSMMKSRMVKPHNEEPP